MNIKTEADYQAVLAEIDRLIDAESNTPAGDRLDVLTTLAEVYEEKNLSFSMGIPNQETIKAMKEGEQPAALSTYKRFSSLRKKAMIKSGTPHETEKIVR